MYFIKMDIDDICITLKKSNDKFDDDDQMDFFKKIIKNQKVFMTMGDKENKLFYVSYQELKTDVEWLCEHVF
jgi:stress response protein SCP2